MLARVGVLLVVLAGLLAPATAPLPAQSPLGIDARDSTAALALHFFDVGQGDAVLIRAPDGRAVLYDGGWDGQRLLRHLKRADVRSLEVVIASHNHADHIGGLAEVIERYRPRFVIDNGVPHTTRAYERFLRAVAAAGSQRLEPTRRALTLDSVRLTILPPAGTSGDQNDNSVGLRIEYGGFHAILLGDSEAAQQHWWLERHPDLLGPVAVHKVSHHGSRNGDTPALIASLRPDVSVIGVGAGNRYGHPDPTLLARLRRGGAEVYRTDLHGTVTVTATRDGTYSVRLEDPGVSGAHSAAAGRPSGAPSADNGHGGACVNLNRANAQALERIVHIGPERAGQIVRLRAQRPFASIEDLTRVRGIGATRARDIAWQGLACVW